LREVMERQHQWKTSKKTVRYPPTPALLGLLGKMYSKI
jgi:hypothetical protein